MANDYSGKADSHDRTFSFFPKIFPSLLLKRLERFVKLFRFNEKLELSELVANDYSEKVDKRDRTLFLLTKIFPSLF